MKSRKVWVIAMAVMKTARTIGEMSEIRGSVANASKKAATRFMWIPGKRPVRVPRRSPRINAVINWSIILFLRF